MTSLRKNKALVLCVIVLVVAASISLAYFAYQQPMLVQREFSYTQTITVFTTSTFSQTSSAATSVTVGTTSFCTAAGKGELTRCRTTTEISSLYIAKTYPHASTVANLAYLTPHSTQSLTQTHQLSGQTVLGMGVIITLVSAFSILILLNRITTQSLKKIVLFEWVRVVPIRLNENVRDVHRRIVTNVIHALSVWIIYVQRLIGLRRQRAVVIWGTQQTSVTQTMAKVSRGAVPDVLDPVTGLEFHEGDDIWQCPNCTSLYHAESRTFVLEHNQGVCVVCRIPSQTTEYDRQLRQPRYRETLRVIDRSRERPAARQVRAFRPSVITIDQARDHIGQIVLFEGYVQGVQRSQTGTYAVKFEQGRWVDVFKLVIFRQYVNSFSNGARTIQSYRGHTIRVRGLIQDHPTFGLEIIVNSENMIEVV